MHSHNGYLHIDGSRISNAAAALDMPIKSFTADCGADVLSFGGTKNGLLMGEAVVVFNTDKDIDKRNNGFQAEILKYIRKQATQLYSKNRFIAAQFDTYLTDNLYITLASHSNAMAKYLEKLLKEIPQVQITQKVESNAVFAIIPKWLTEELLKKYYFYIWDEQTGEVRWMCSFNTQKENIEEFVADIKSLISKI